MSRKKWGSAIKNNRTYIDIYDRLKNIALNVFKWQGLPDTVNAEYMERQLFSRGYCLFFNDSQLGYIALQCALGGGFDVYNIPIIRTAFAANGYHAEYNRDNSVIIWNNSLHLPTENTVSLFAERLYEIERAIDVNVKGQKFPIAITSNDEKTRLSMKNLYMQYDGNEPFIFTTKNLLSDNDVKAINTGSPFVADKLNALKHQIMNEFLTFIGVENSNIDKKERLVADEVSSNYGGVEAQRNVLLLSRQRACDEINRMFGLNVSCEFNSNAKTIINKTDEGSGNNE